MRRRHLLHTCLTGGILLSGCLGDSSSTPTQIGGGEFPKYSGTVTLSTDDHWAIELPKYDELNGPEAVYKYDISIETPDGGPVDVYFFDEKNFNDYDVGGGNPYDELSSPTVEERVTKEGTVSEYYGAFFIDKYCLVIDNTEYGETEPSDGPDSIELDVTVEVYPDGVGPVPEVGDITFESGDRGSPWNLVVNISDDLSSGALKIYKVSDNYEDKLLERRNISNSGQRMEFEYINGGLSVTLGGRKYLFHVEQDDKVVAQSRLSINRRVSASSPRFEQHIGGKSLDGVEDQILGSGAISFSINITNEAAAPLVISEVSATDLFRPDSRMWIDSEVEGRSILPPGDTRRYGAVGYNLPELDEVDSICDGTRRSTRILIDTVSGFSAQYKLEYSIDEPAHQVGPEIDYEKRYACQSGTIYELTEISHSQD